VIKTGFSLLDILHRENPVFITGMGLQCGRFIGKVIGRVIEDLFEDHGNYLSILVGFFMA
jgi:hypothetical protein